MQILFQIQRSHQKVQSVIRSGGHEHDQILQDLFFVLQQMAHLDDEQPSFRINDDFMINLMRLILFGAYHMNYRDGNGEILPDHDVYLDAPLEHDYANRRIDYAHIATSLDNVFRVLIDDASIGDSNDIDGDIVSMILATLGAIEPTATTLPTLEISLIPDVLLLEGGKDDAVK